MGLFARKQIDALARDPANLGMWSAFAVACIGVPVLRIAEPDRPRPFRVSFVRVIGLGGAAAACVFGMWGPASAWLRFANWLALGLVFYFAHGYRSSVLRRGTMSPVTEKPS